MWDIDSSQFCLIYLDIIIVSSPFFGNLGNLFWSQSVQEVSNMVTRGLEAPDKINIFSSSVQWIFQPSQCFMNIAILKMATKCHEAGVQNTLSMVFAGDSAPHHFQNFICLRRIAFIVNFSVPWPIAGTSPCRHCSFSIHIDMLGWTAVDWAGHRCGSLHGHKWSLCTTSTAYQLYSVLASSVFAFCEWTQSDSVCTYFMYMNNKETYQLMYHEKGTAYQQVYHFMYMNHKQTSQLMYHAKVHSTSFNEDEPSRAYYQERSHPPPPANPPNQHPAYQHLCHFMKMNHRGPGRTSPCHKNNMNHIFM